MKNIAVQIKKLIRDKMEDTEVAERIRNERRITSSTINIVWVVSLISTGVAVYVSDWAWCALLLTPVALNALIVNRAYHRISKDTGVDVRLVHDYWRQLQKADLKR